MPSFELLENYARKVEDEMSPGAREESRKPKRKKCPACTPECEVGDKICPACGHEFPRRQMTFKNCPACGQLNLMGADDCQFCGHSFRASFVLSLEEALRTGAIVRGIDIDEVDVQEGERLAAETRSETLESGDKKLIRLMRQVPDELWGRLRQILKTEE